MTYPKMKPCPICGQAEDAASGEPPRTMQEQYIDAWTFKQALRS